MSDYRIELTDPEDYMAPSWRIFQGAEKHDPIATVYKEADAERIVAALSRAEPGIERRAIFDAGFQACLDYGDNWRHYQGEQADRVFARAMKKLALPVAREPGIEQVAAALKELNGDIAESVRLDCMSGATGMRLLARVNTILSALSTPAAAVLGTGENRLAAWLQNKAASGVISQADCDWALNMLGLSALTPQVAPLSVPSPGLSAEQRPDRGALGLIVHEVIKRRIPMTKDWKELPDFDKETSRLIGEAIAEAVS